MTVIPFTTANAFAFDPPTFTSTLSTILFDTPIFTSTLSTIPFDTPIFTSTLSTIPFDPPIFTSTLTSTLTSTPTSTTSDITTVTVSATSIAPTSQSIPTTKSLHPRDLLIGVAIGAGPFFIAMAIFLLSRRFKHVSKRKGLLKSKEQYNTAHLQRDPSVETASLRDDDGLAGVSPLGYSDIDKSERSRISRPTSGPSEPYTRLIVTESSPETLSSSPPWSSSPNVSEIQIPTLPITDFQDENEEDQVTENPQESFRRSFRIAHNSFVTPTRAVSSSYRQHVSRPLPCLPISRKDMNLERVSACLEMVEVSTSSPFVGSSTASIISENHTDSGLRFGKQTLPYDESKLSAKKIPPPTYTRN